MRQDVLSSVAENLGIVAAAERALRQKTFSESAETLLLARWRELDWDQLLGWLSHEPPGGSERPIGAIIDRIVERVPHDLARFTFLEVPGAIARIHNPEVRDLLVERLQTHIDELAWCHLAPYAVGHRVFNRVRDVELQPLDSVRSPPDDAVVHGRTLCSLIAMLFEERRDDTACIRLLRERARDPKLRIYVLWLVSEAGLLADLGEPKDVLGDVPSLAEVDPAERSATRTVLDIARSWPEKEGLRAWLVNRWASAAERGVPWETLWWEIDAGLRDDVALATPRHAPIALVLDALSHRFSGNELWDRALTVLEAVEDGRRLGDGELFNQGLQHATWTLGRKVIGEEVSVAFKAFDPQSVTAWIMNTPFPQEADETFDERFLAVARRWGKGLVLLEDMLGERLLALPLTTDRARRILLLTLRSSSSHFWAMDRCVEIAKAATGDGFTDDIPIPFPLNETALAAYRVLVGQDADERLAAHLDERLRAEDDVYAAVAVAETIRTHVDDVRRERLRTLALRLPLVALADIQSLHPWLITEADVVREAARDDREWDRAEAERLPKYLRPVITARAVTSLDERLARSLLERLETLGMPRRELLGIVLERVRAHGVHAIEPSWLGKRLDTRSLWERDPGRAIVATLLREGDAEGTGALLQLCFETACSENAKALVAVAHTVIAEVLTELARAALECGDAPFAKRALAGIGQLSPGLHVRGAIRALRRLTKDPDVERLIGMNEDLLRRDDNRDAPTLDSIHDALRDVAYGSRGAR